MPKSPAVTAYQNLVDQISRLYEDARRSQVRFAWETGRRIVEVEQDGNVRADYGSGLLPKLSEDLTVRYGGGFSVGNLQLMRRLYLEKSKYQPADKLSLTHYGELFRVKNLKKRRDLEKRAEQENLTKYDLRALIRKEGKTSITPGVMEVKPLVRPTDLKLHTFKAAKPEVASLWTVGKGEILVDCGFFVYRPVAGKALEGALTETPSYTYRATIERVVDGDTLLVLIDTGFGNILEEKLRLRGINCAELGTPEGEKAKRYVEKILPVGAAIVIRSRKDDKYGRFVADIFYLRKDPFANTPSPRGDQPGARGAGYSSTGNSAEKIIAEGEWLNGELLEKGLAERYE